MSIQHKQIHITLLIVFIVLAQCFFIIDIKAESTRNKPRAIALTCDSFSLKKIQYALDCQTVISTHDDWFKGASVTVNYPLSGSTTIGLGTEFTYSPLHNDNNWILRDLKFIPVFIDFKWLFWHNKQITTFFHTSEGISFVNYSKEETPGNIYHVCEQGLYFYAGLGASLKLTNYLSSFVDIGFKGFQMSFNELEVNPHGVTIRVGLCF